MAHLQCDYSPCAYCSVDAETLWCAAVLHNVNGDRSVTGLFRLANNRFQRTNGQSDRKTRALPGMFYC